MDNFDRLLVKAKRVDNGEWVMGWYYFDDISNVHLITPSKGNPNLNADQIDSDTIFQCTGLKDKNGVLIFESDEVRFGENLSFGPITDTVIWNKDKLEYTLQHDSIGFVLGRLEDIEVIGNVHNGDIDER